MNLRQTRVGFAAAAVIFICIGVVMIYSASAIYAYENLGDSAYYLKRHLLYLLVGFVGAVLAMLIPLERLQKAAKPLLLFSCLLLLILLLPGVGRAVGGARRWFRIGSLSFQPSELSKFAMILYTADFLVRKRVYLHSALHGFLPLLIVLIGVCLLIIVQPDLGTVLSIAAICGVMAYVGGVRGTHMAGLLLGSLPLLYWLIFSVEYRRNRILAFIDPWSDPQGTGFQIIQSLVALGSGGVTGSGLGQGKQKLLYLPAAYTDFIVSILGEELGFIGTGGLVLLSTFFLFQGTKICLKARDSFSQLLGIGLLSALMVEVIVNLGVVTSLLPTKGLPFPFISYGGTSLMFNMMFVGLILNIGRTR